MLISRKTMAVVGTLLLSLVLAASCYSPREIEADEATTNGANRANDVIATVDTEGSEELGEEQLKALLEVEEDHPAKKVRYKVREQYPDQIKDTFEGLAKDPYGPQIDVDWRWVITGEVIEINAPERAHEKFFEPVFAEWKEWVSSRPTKVENTTFRSPFPTLQEQLAADVAYKLLGVELEKLTDEEIERVKAMGHQGGLRVSAYGGGGFGRGSGGPLRNGDLLVGLHVWPTTSLDQVNHVLSRDDLDRLSPLKFYVIRRQEAPRQPPAEGYGEVEYGAAYGETATMVDQLVTGRIAVNLDAWRAVRQQRGIVAQDVDLIQTDEVIGKERTRSSMTRESLEKLHKQLAKDLQEKYDRYLTLSQELDSADTPNASAVLGVLANEVRLIQQQIIQKKEELLEIEVMKTLAIQQANSPSALDTAIQDELSADPMFQSFQQEQYAITQQLTQLIATTKGRGSPELSRLQQHLRNLEQQIQEYRLTKETEIRNRLNSAPNDMLAQVNSEYLLRRNSIVAELVELESQYEEKMEEVQRKGETSGTLAILKSEIEQLQEVAKTMELKLRSWEMKEIAGHNRVRVLQEAMLLYDGKTFDQWRELWKTELKTENRIECIKALAAFGRAGYGKQAVEAILEVARQYDYFRPGGSEQIQEFKNAAIQALAGSDGIPAEIWLPLLLARLEEEPRQWSDLTSLALAYVHGAEPDVIAILKAVSQGPGHTSEVRGAALAALVRHDEWTKDEEIVAMVHQALAGEESLVTSQVMGALRFKHLDLFPKQRDLLFHEDDTVHQTAVYSLRYLYDSTFASDILNSLLVVLDDPQLADDHLRVIQSFHALSFGGSWTNPVLAKRKPEVVARLEEILVEGDSSLLPWTIEALGLLTASDSAIVINRVRDSVTEQRGRELQTAAELAKGLRLQGGGGFIGSGGGGF